MFKRHLLVLCFSLLVASSFIFVSAQDSAEEDVVVPQGGSSAEADNSVAHEDDSWEIIVELVSPEDGFSVQDDSALIDFEFLVNSPVDVRCELIAGGLATPFQGTVVRSSSNGIIYGDSAGIDDAVNVMSRTFAPGTYEAIIKCTENPVTTQEQYRTGEDSIGFTVTSPPSDDGNEDTANGGGDDGVSPGTPFNQLNNNAENEVQPLSNQNSAGDLTSDDDAGLFSRITGAFLGPNGLTGLGGIIIIALIIAVVGLALYFRKR